MPNPIKIHISKRNLTQWYVVEQRSYRWIMSKTGCNAARGIKRLLVEYGIEVRHGSKAVKTQWTDAEKRRRDASKAAKKVFRPYWGTQSKRPEVREKIRLSKLGDKNPMFGKTGPKSSNWLGGKESWTRGRKIEPKRKKEIIKKLGGKCEKCGTTKKLTIHHDPPWRVCRIHDLKFLHALCESCHFSGPNHLR